MRPPSSGIHHPAASHNGIRQINALDWLLGNSGAM
jgi:hypothetical protein